MTSGQPGGLTSMTSMTAITAGKRGLQLVAEEAETPLTTIMVSTRLSQLFQFLIYRIHKSLQLGSGAIPDFWQTCFISPWMFGKVWPTFSGWTLLEIANPTGFGEGEEGKELHLLAPTSTIHPTQLLLHLIFRGEGGGKYILQGWRATFQQMRGGSTTFQNYSNCPKMSQIICNAAT